MKHKRYPGFTIVEILVVIIIIAMLASMVAFFYAKQQAESRDQKRDADIHALIHELDAYYEKTGNYPLSCEHSAPIISSCSEVTSDYTAAYGTPTPPTIGYASDIATIRASLPGLLEFSFGDPLKKTDNPINQHITSGSNYIKTTSYYLLSVDALNIGSTAYFATNSSGSTYITCSYSPIQYDYQGAYKGNRPHSYIVGYFSEVDKKWIFYQGPKLDTTNNLRWNSSNKSECAISNP